MRRSNLHLPAIALAACFWAAPVEVCAQAKDAFVESLIALAQAADGRAGDEGPSLEAAIAAMASGLESWDRAVARVESGFKGAITGAAPREAAQMRAALAAAYLERGRVADALTHLDAAAGLDATAPSVHLLRGLAAGRAGRPAGAVEAFGRAHQLDPSGSATAYLYLAATRGAAPSPQRAQAMDALLRAAIATGAGTAAPPFSVPSLDFIEDGAVDAPLVPLASYADAFALVGQGRHVEALARFRTAVASDPLLTDRLLASPAARAASAALRKGDGRGAVEAFHLVPGGDQSGEVQRLLGLSYWALADYAKSLDHLRAASRLNPGDERARLSLADVLVAAGDPVAARAVLAETIDTFATSGQAQWRLGRLSLDLGDEASALQAYESVARLTPLAGAAGVYATIGRLQHRKLDLEGAASAYERRVRLTPNVGEAHLDLADVYLAQDQVEDALVEYAAGALVEPSSARAFASLGRVRADAAGDEDAVHLFQAAVRLDAAHLEARYGLSRALLRLGRVDEARRELEAFERLQKAAMEAERRRFDENSRAIDSVLRDGSQQGRGR